MNSLPASRSGLVLALALASASVGLAQFTNSSFETGTLAGWSVSAGGRASVVGSVTDYPFDHETLTEDLTKPYSVSPYNGSFQARLSAGATPLAGVETFLELETGTLSSSLNNPFGLADASAIAQTVWLNQGDSVLIHWNFLAVDTEDADDFAFLSLSSATGSSVSILSSVRQTGSGNGTGWLTAHLTAGMTGEYRVGLGVANFGDDTVSSLLYADAISAVPEPSSYGFAAAVLGLGAALWRQRRRQSA